MAALATPLLDALAERLADAHPFSRVRRGRGHRPLTERDELRRFHGRLRYSTHHNLLISANVRLAGDTGATLVYCNYSRADGTVHAHLNGPGQNGALTNLVDNNDDLPATLDAVVAWINDALDEGGMIMSLSGYAPLRACLPEGLRAICPLQAFE